MTRRRNRTTIDGRVMRAWRSPTGSAVAQLQVDNEIVPVLASNMALVSDEVVCLEGKWTPHAGSGRLFLAAKIRTRPPESLAASASMLAEALEVDIGDVNRLISRFGDDLLSVLDGGHAKRLTDAGFDAGMARTMMTNWAAYRSHQALAPLLGKLGLDEAALEALRNVFGSSVDLDRQLRENPYSVILHLQTAQWDRVERVARELGIAEDASQRFDAAVIAELRARGFSGHTYMTLDWLREAALARLGLSERRTARRTLEARIDTLRAERLLTIDADRVFLPQAFEEAAALAEGVLSHSRALADIDPPDDREALGHALSQLTVPEGVDPWDLGTFALGGALSVICVQGLEAALDVATGLDQVCGVLKIKMGLICPTIWAEASLNERGLISQPVTLHEILGTPPRYDKISGLQVELIVVLGADQLSSDQLHGLFRARPDGVGLVLIGDDALDTGFILGRPFRDIASAGDEVGEAIRMIRHRTGGALVARARRLMEAPDAIGRLQRRFQLPLSAHECPADEVAGAVCNIVERVLPRLGAIDESYAVCYPRRAGLPDPTILADRLEQIESTQSAVPFGRRSWRPGAKLYFTEPLPGEIPVPAFTRLELRQVDASPGPFPARTIDGRELAITAAQLERAFPALVAPVHVLLWQPVDTLILMLPSGRLHHARRILYSMAASARRRLILVGATEAFTAALADDHSEPSSLLKTTLVGRAHHERVSP